MKLTQAERKALQESINHWQEDIINKFVGENSIARISSLYWKKSKKIVDCYSDSCPLCRKYFGILGYACMDCPYCKFYNKKCTFLHWRSFNEIPTKENAIAMRDSLQAILDSDKEKVNYMKVSKKFLCTAVSNNFTDCVGYQKGIFRMCDNLSIVAEEFICTSKYLIEKDEKLSCNQP